jgi:hypothetical protein
VYPLPLGVRGLCPRKNFQITDARMCVLAHFSDKNQYIDACIYAVFELPGGLNPPVVCLTPKHDALGGQFQPPAVVNDAESPMCNGNDNE